MRRFCQRVRASFPHYSKRGVSLYSWATPLNRIQRGQGCSTDAAERFFPPVVVLFPRVQLGLFV